MDNKIIDGVVRLVVRGDKLPTEPKWPELREEMAECQFLSVEDLDRSKEYIIEKFFELRLERIQQHKAKLLGRPIPPKDSSSQGSNNDSGFNGSCKESESDDEGSFQPTVIETGNVSDVLHPFPLAIS